MHTILAFSDTHSTPLPRKLKQVAEEADLVFFLGDGVTSLSDFMLHKGFHAVDGNCDPHVFGTEEIVEVEGLKILLTHGHLYSVKRDLLPLALRAKELGCGAAFYGHTHCARIDEFDGVTLICPGSPCYPFGSAASYAYTVVHERKIISKIVNIQ